MGLHALHTTDGQCMPDLIKQLEVGRGLDCGRTVHHYPNTVYDSRMVIKTIRVIMYYEYN